jgi:hypothetical protein
VVVEVWSNKVPVFNPSRFCAASWVVLFFFAEDARYGGFERLGWIDATVVVWFSVCWIGESKGRAHACWGGFVCAVLWFRLFGLRQSKGERMGAVLLEWGLALLDETTFRHVMIPECRLARH